MRIKEMSLMMAFLSHIIKDEQLDKTHENYCGFVNLGSAFFGTAEYDLARGYATFVHNYEKEKSKLDALLELEGIKVQKVDIDETILEVISKIAHPNMIIGNTITVNEQILLYSTNNEYVVVRKKLKNDEFTTEYSSTFDKLGEAHYDYQIQAEQTEYDVIEETSLVDKGIIDIPEYERM